MFRIIVDVAVHMHYFMCLTVLYMIPLLCVCSWCILLCLADAFILTGSWLRDTPWRQGFEPATSCIPVWSFWTSKKPWFVGRIFFLYKIKNPTKRLVRAEMTMFLAVVTPLSRISCSVSLHILSLCSPAFLQPWPNDSDTEDPICISHTIYRASGCLISGI